MTIDILKPVFLNSITLSQHGFDWADINATTSSDLQAIHRDLTYLAYPEGPGRTAYISMPHPSGLARFFFHVERNETGYGGAVFELPMHDGPPVRIKGPWSGREGLVNKITGRELVDVNINNTACSMDRSILQPQLLEVNRGWTLQSASDYEGEITYSLPSTLAPPRQSRPAPTVNSRFDNAR